METKQIFEIDISISFNFYMAIVRVWSSVRFAVNELIENSILKLVFKQVEQNGREAKYL